MAYAFHFIDMALIFIFHTIRIIRNGRQAFSTENISTLEERTGTVWRCRIGKDHTDGQTNTTRTVRRCAFRKKIHRNPTGPTAAQARTKTQQDSPTASLARKAAPAPPQA
jgi:hypothetical protein